VKPILTGKTQAGVVWAAQGPGKSLTMLRLSVKLRRLKKLRNPFIAIVTDRTDSSEKITNMFRRCGLSDLRAPKVFGICANCRGRRQARPS
jgi:type I restriction enzyme, R subunit